MRLLHERKECRSRRHLFTQKNAEERIEVAEEINGEIALQKKSRNNTKESTLKEIDEQEDKEWNLKQFRKELRNED